MSDPSSGERPPAAGPWDEPSSVLVPLGEVSPADAALGHLTYRVIGGALAVHTNLGPGHFESAYRRCLAYELRKRGLGLRTEVPMPIHYGDVVIQAGYRVDLLVEEMLIVELKCVERLHELHKAQVLSYLKLSNRRLGLLINFNVEHLRDGLSRIINPEARHQR